MVRRINFLSLLSIAFFVFTNFAWASPLTGDSKLLLAFDPEMNRYLAVYFNYDGSNYQSVKAKFVNPDGTEGSSFAIADGTDAIDYDNGFPVYDPINRRFLVVFTKYDSGSGTNYDIWGQFVSQSGTLIGGAFAINNYVGVQSYPVAAYDSKSQRFFVIWVDMRDAGNFEIYGQLLDKIGTKIGSWVNVSDISGHEYSGTVAYMDSKESYVVAWLDGGSEIHARLVDKDGVDTGSMFEIVAAATAAGDTQLMWDNSGSRLMTVWEDNRDTSNRDIYGKLVNIDSPSSGANFPVYYNDNTSYKDEAQVAFDSKNGRYLVAWLMTSKLPPSPKTHSTKPEGVMGIDNMDVYARYVTSAGDVSGDAFTVLEDQNRQERLSLAYNSNCSNFLAGISSMDKVTTLSYLGFKIVGDPCSNPPSAPELKSPENGATNVDTDVTLKWEKSVDPDGDEVSYSVLVCDNENFLGCESAAVASVAKPNKDYAMAGFTGVSALILIFLMGSALRFRKRAIALVIFFVLSGFLVFQFGCGSGGLSYKATGLSSSTTYYWKVIATDGKGGISHSETWSFTTK